MPTEIDESLPRVSAILAVAGVLPDRTFLTDFALERGQMVHLYTEMLDRGTLDESDVDPVIAPYLDGYKRLKKATGVRILGIEEKCQSRYYRGRFDRTVCIDGKFGVAEIKCGFEYPWHRLQTQGYSDTQPPEYFNRWGFYLSPEYSLGFKVREFKDRADIGAWRSFVVGYHWKEANGCEDQILEAIASIQFGGEQDAADPFRYA